MTQAAQQQLRSLVSSVFLPPGSQATDAEIVDIDFFIEDIKRVIISDFIGGLNYELRERLAIHVTIF